MFAGAAVGALCERGRGGWCLEQGVAVLVGGGEGIADRGSRTGGDGGIDLTITLRLHRQIFVGGIFSDNHGWAGRCAGACAVIK